MNWTFDDVNDAYKAYLSNGDDLLELIRTFLQVTVSNESSESSGEPTLVGSDDLWSLRMCL